MFHLLRPAVIVAGLMINMPCLAQEASEEPERFQLQRGVDSVTVRLDGQLFTKYHTLDTQVPYMWPVIGPGGVELTRAFPMRPGGAEEAVDHLHHRSLWFAHGDVNGIDFWHNANKAGRIEHQRFLRMDDSDEPAIITENAWLDDTGVKQCTDVRVIRFGADKESRWIDFDISIIADGDEPVTFGDTKEGCLGIRVAGSMKVDAGLGGTIINNNDDRDEDAWGKTGAWVDYNGPS